MAVPTLEELFTQLTREQFEASAIDIAQRLELPVTAWEDGSVGREIIVILCELMSTYLSGASSTAAAAGMLDYATGEWLPLTGSQIYDTPILEATFATCTERLTNTSTTPYVIVAEDLRFGKPSGGPGTDQTATYVNTSGGSLAAWSGVGDYPVLDVDLVCEQAGSFGNASFGEIVEFITPLAGVICSNTTPAVGNDAEGRTAYITRCREAVARLSPNGPSDAYNYFAKSTLRGDGSNCGVTRTLPYQPKTQPGVVIVYVASEAGPVEASDVALVQTNLLENVTPTGITVTTASAVPLTIGISATIYLGSGSTAAAADIQAAALAALTEYFEIIPIGGYVLAPGATGAVYLEAVIGTVFQASSQIIQVVVTVPVTDIPLQPNEVAVLTSTLASFNVVATA